MKTRRDFVTWLSAISLAGLARPLAADACTEGAAEDAARQWLAVVDEGGYEASWEGAAPLFRSSVTKEEWQKALETVRAPLGRCRSRRLLSRKIVDALPGAPKGPYVVIQYATEFDARKDAVETITPMRSADGRCLVSGYFIK